MTARRFAAQPTKTPALTGGEDQPRPACEGRWFVYDILVDYSSGPVFQQAQREARSICSTCPLAASCLTANRAEPWAAAVLGEHRARRFPTPHAEKRPHVSEMLRAKHARFNAERSAALQRLAAAGASRVDAVAELGVTKSALYQWCLAHGHKETWNALRQEVAA